MKIFRPAISSCLACILLFPTFASVAQTQNDFSQTIAFTPGFRIDAIDAGPTNSYTLSFTNVPIPFRSGRLTISGKGDIDHEGESVRVVDETGSYLGNLFGEASEPDISETNSLVVPLLWLASFASDRRIDFVLSCDGGAAFFELESATLSYPTNGPPELSIQVGDVDICWNTETNKSYQLEYQSPQTTNAWLPIGAAVFGSGSRTCIVDSIRGQSGKFYRIREL